MPADLGAFAATIRDSITKDVITSIIDALSEKFLGGRHAATGTGGITTDMQAAGLVSSPGYSAQGASQTVQQQQQAATRVGGIASGIQAAGVGGIATDIQATGVGGIALDTQAAGVGSFAPDIQAAGASGDVNVSQQVNNITMGAQPKAAISAAERIGAINAVPVPIEKNENKLWTVKLGNTPAEGGTRGVTYNIGGASCMPFHLWEGEMPNRPLVAMEVFDRVSEKYPAVLRELYKDVLGDPAQMAAYCVKECGADLISVRLDATHPERGDKSAAESVELVGAILKAVDVPLIITGHNNWDKINQVMKAIAQSFEGENLLLNWAEQDNYRTIAGAAIAYGHSVVSQAPIDVNISKQLNILLTNMDIKPDKIVMDPMTSAIGYGVEYTYSVMERIRLTGLGGDKMLCGPMIVSPGQECIKIKEYKASEADFPAWGSLEKRAAIWEFSTAVSLLHAGADILIMYHPEAAMGVKKTIFELMDRPAG